MTETIVTNENEGNRKVGEVATSLISLLRRYDTVAYVVGVKQGRTVKNWAEKGVVPSDPVMQTRLKVAEALAKTVNDEQRPWVSGSWLIACNPHLGESSPSEMIQSLAGTSDDHQVTEKLYQAAELFASTPG
jgi:hypothetical protein